MIICPKGVSEGMRSWGCEYIAYIALLKDQVGMDHGDVVHCVLVW